MVTALEQYDPQIYELLKQEEARQSGSLRMIPSENYVSRAVLSATSSCLTNRYSEGYPGKRYYEGQQVTDLIEIIARERARKIFKAEHANVQPYSGSVANLAALNALLNPGDTMMGLSLASGGHLTHGAKASFTSKVFNVVPYSVDPRTGYLDYDRIESLAVMHKPKVIISGMTAYPRAIDFKAFGEIAKRVGAFHISDIAHLAGLVAAGLHLSPVPYADVTTTTTHKTLRGPRGGMILTRKELEARGDRAVFPGNQGGPPMHTIAALGVALKEADTDEFIAYARQVVANAKRLAASLMECGFTLVTGGTDNHLILIDLRPLSIPGKKLAKALDRAGIVTNFNSVPGDDAPPTNPNGIRIGTPAITTRGMKEEQMDTIAKLMETVARNVDREEVIEKVSREVLLLCSQFPVPDHFIVQPPKA